MAKKLKKEIKKILDKTDMDVYLVLTFGGV